MNQTDLLVGIHGSGLANMLFLPPTSAVLELFPFLIELPIYELVAQLRGFPYGRWQGPHPSTLRPARDRAPCLPAHFPDPVRVAADCDPVDNWPCHECIRASYNVLVTELADLRETITGLHKAAAAAAQGGDPPAPAASALDQVKIARSINVVQDRTWPRVLAPVEGL